MPRTHRSLKRLYVEAALAAGSAIDLGREPSNYLGAVLRMEPGGELVVFNGRDGAWRARVASGGKKAMTLALVEQIAPQPPAADLWYGFAPLKTGRLEYVVQKATEMGVGAIQPVITRFTQGRPREDKLRAYTIEAAEQCDVLNLPAILPEIALPDLLAGWDGSRALIFADEAAPAGSPAASLTSLAGRPLGLLIGPEGGFAEDERAALLSQPFVVPVSLGPRILRADTAAVAALAVIQAIIGDWR